MFPMSHGEHSPSSISRDIAVSPLLGKLHTAKLQNSYKTQNTGLSEPELRATGASRNLMSALSPHPSLPALLPVTSPIPSGPLGA